MATWYCLAPWQWVEDPATGEQGWSAPAGTAGLFDMRPATDSVHGFFAIRADARPEVDGAIWLGDGTDFRDYFTSQAERDAWRDALGLTTEQIPDSNRLLRDVLIQTFEECGDPDWGVRFKPPTCTHDGYLEFHLGGHSLISRRRFTGTDDPAWARIQALLQRGYRRVREHALEHGRNPHERETHLRLLSTWMRKYRVDDHRLFIPSGLPDEGTRRPETSISDAFTDSDGTLLENHTPTDGGGWTWSVVNGGCEINSNRAEQQTNDAWNIDRADQDLSSADHYTQADLMALLQSTKCYVGIMARKDATATKTFYQVRYSGWSHSDGLNRYELRKVVSGSETTFDHWSSDLTAGDTLYLECDGSTITMLINGEQRAQTTDTSITGNLRTGFASYRRAAYDNYEAADLGGGAVSLAPDDLSTAPEVESAAVTQLVGLAPADLESSPALGAAAVTTGTLLAPADLSTAPALEATGLAVVHRLAPADASAAPDLDAGGLVLLHTLAPDDLSAAPTLESTAVATALPGVACDDYTVTATLERPLVAATLEQHLVSGTLGPFLVDGSQT